jgi:hypothetical protein
LLLKQSPVARGNLQMDHPSRKHPENLEREIRMLFLVHNLVRRLMLEAWLPCAVTARHCYRHARAAHGND